MTDEQNTDKKVNPFVTDLWKAEYCDPSNWAYKPSTYGIEGATLVGEPQMMLFSEMTGHWINPGRKLRINEYKLREMKEYMLEHGIDTDKGEFGYVDADTDAAINLNHRRELGLHHKEVDLPGWMVQKIRFDSETARILFANLSNVVLDVPHINPSVKDVEAAVRDLCSLLDAVTEIDVKTFIEKLGVHLGKTNRGNILRSIMLDLNHGEKKVKTSQRYSTYSKATIDYWMDKYCNDDWIDDVFLEKRVQIITQYNIDSDLSAILRANRDAIVANEPLNLLIACTEPSRNESLATKRSKFFETTLEKYEDLILQMVGQNTDKWNRGRFAWNHPDAQNRFVPQCNATETDGKLIYVKNRTFN